MASSSWRVFGMRGLGNLWVAALFLLFPSCASISLADASYYKVYIGSSVRPAIGDHYWEGYARLELGELGKEGTGKLCIRGKEAQTVQVVQPTEDELQLRIPNFAELGIDEELITFYKGEPAFPEYSKEAPRWIHKTPAKNEPQQEAPSATLLSMDMFTFPRDWPLRSLTEEELKFSSLNIQNAFKEQLDQLQKGERPGIQLAKVFAVLDASKAVSLNEFLPTINAEPLPKESVENPCDVPVLVERIKVSPLVEKWSASKILSTGLALDAGVVYLATGPGALNLEIQSPELMRALYEDGRPIAERDLELVDVIRQTVVSFAVARQRNFEPVGTVVRLVDNTPFFYRFEIKGLSLSRCESNRWERIVLQMHVYKSTTTVGGVASFSRFRKASLP